MQNARKLVVANWKMNFDVPGSVAYFTQLLKRIQPSASVEVVVCPTFLSIFALTVKNQGHFSLGAQTCQAEDSGALTGEVSAAMLADLVDYVIVGHSERRRNFGETDGDINQKVLAGLRHNLRPIVCIGETLNQKQSGQTETVLANQLDGALNTINASQLSNLVVAYEPVWAIGSSVTPTAAELGQLMQIIKNQLVQMFGSAGQSIRLLYGGSVDTDNAGPLLAVESVNGFLVGSSSLNMDKFATIVKIAEGSGND